MALTPSDDFRWSKVLWDHPDEPVSGDVCSYCRNDIDEDDIPLQVWTKDKWGAQFCDACQEKYFGLQKV